MKKKDCYKQSFFLLFNIHNFLLVVYPVVEQVLDILYLIRQNDLLFLFVFLQDIRDNLVQIIFRYN